MRRFRQQLALPENVLPVKLAVRIAFPRHVAAVRHAEVGAKQLSVLAEQIVDLSLAPNIERPLGLPAFAFRPLPFARILRWKRRIGILRREEPARRTGEVAPHVVENAAGHPGIAFVARRLSRLKITDRELRLVVEHFLEVRHEPFRIHRVAVEAAAHVVVQATLGHLAQREHGHLDRRGAGRGGHARDRRHLKQEVEHRRTRKLRCPAKPALCGVK